MTKFLLPQVVFALVAPGRVVPNLVAGMRSLLLANMAAMRVPPAPPAGCKHGLLGSSA